MNKQTIISILIILIALGAILFFVQEQDKKPGKYDQFAMCLAEEEATFWGAFWCPACQQQKSLFGRKSAELLPYTECSTPDGQATNQVCVDAEITGYPTWDFADGSRVDGVMTLEQLAEKTSCELPA
jgi:thiol-disulfide isomerase/thioredoxin